MNKPKSVLAIGLDPAVAPVAGFPTDQVRAFIEGQLDKVRGRGFDVTSCLIDRGETAELTVRTALEASRFDCVVIGAGLRQPPELLTLFEKILNLIHRLAPRATICFNTKPDDTAEAVERWIAPT